MASLEQLKPNVSSHTVLSIIASEDRALAYHKAFYIESKRHKLITLRGRLEMDVSLGDDIQIRLPGGVNQRSQFETSAMVSIEVC